MSLYLPAAGRGMGLRWQGPKGSRKTLGSVCICFQDFLSGKAVFLLDAQGTASDLFLHLADKQPPSVRRELGKRIIYVDMAGTSGRIVPMPIYHPQGREPLTATAERPLEVWRRINPELRMNPTVGDNAMTALGRSVGVVLTALGWGIAEAEALLTNRGRFRERLEQLAREKPETAEHVAYLHNLPPNIRSREWQFATGAYLNKVRDLTFDHASRALYGAAQPGFAWEDAAEQGKAVLLDFRAVDQDRLRQFGAIWAFRSVLSYIQRRPNRGRAVVICIDELLYFLSSDPKAQEVLAADFNHLVQTLSRARSAWLLIAHQELNQLTKPMGNALMGMGSQIFSASADLEGGAEVWAKRFSKFDPLWEKAVIYRPGSRTTPASETPIFYTMQEQIRLWAQKYQELEPGCFYASISPREGKLGGEPVKFCLPPFPSLNGERIERNKALLLQRDGRPIETILAELAARLEDPPDASATPTRLSPLPSSPAPAVANPPPGRLIAEAPPQPSNLRRPAHLPPPSRPRQP